MNNYNIKSNKDDVFIRSMIISLLAELNKKLCIYNRLDNNKVERVDIPCLYSITGGERFLKDEFYYDALQIRHSQDKNQFHQPKHTIFFFVVALQKI